jgi:hypothetical protein
VRSFFSHQTSAALFFGNYLLSYVQTIKVLERKEFSCAFSTLLLLAGLRGLMSMRAFYYSSMLEITRLLADSSFMPPLLLLFFWSLICCGFPVAVGSSFLAWLILIFNITRS